MPTVIKLAVARHGARADDDPLWAGSDPSAHLWDPPLSRIGIEQVQWSGEREEQSISIPFFSSCETSTNP